MSSTIKAILVISTVTLGVWGCPWLMESLVIAESSSISTLEQQQAQQLLQQAQNQLSAKNYRQAIANLSQAIGINPSSADLYYQRGLVLEDLGDKSGAIRDFDSAILRNPHHAWAYLHRAGLSFNFGLNLRVTDDRGADWRILDYAANNSQAMLDLRTARDLFAQQGDEQGYQIADNLIQHFGERLEP